jgi:prephenate dehydrogenase
MNALIIGLGLIGGSIAKAFKKYEIAKHITVFDPNQNSCNLALQQQIANEICYNLNKKQIAKQNIIVIACPISTYLDILPTIFKFAHKNALIFDVGSLKNFAELDFASIKPNFDPAIFNNLPANFVPAHPIAGSHLTGYENSSENLFVNKKFVICPFRSRYERKEERTHIKFVNQLYDIVIKIQAKHLYLDAKKHDEIYTLISHLPQYISFELKHKINYKELKSDFFQTAFRLDNSDQNLWKEIFTLNGYNIVNLYNKLLLDCPNLYKNVEYNVNYFKEPDLKKIKHDLKNLDNHNILSRLMMVICYLNLDKIKDYKQYAGKGFADFTSLIKIIPQELNNLLK